MKLSLALTLLFFSSQLVAQLSKIARINKRTQIITVIDSTKGFYSETNLEFTTNPEKNLIEIDYNGLYPVDNLELFKVKKQKLIPENNYMISDLDIENEFFYLDSKYKLIECEPNSKFICKYKQHSTELMFLCNILLNQAYQVDTFEYYIRIPENYQLIYNTINTDSLKMLVIDTVKENNYTVFHIKSVTNEPLNPYNAYKQNYSLIRTPMLRTIVTPKDYKNKESEYFRKWYWDLLKPVSTLTPESKNLSDSLTNNITNRDSIINILYSYIQKSIRYVGMYKGIGAFQPHDVNEVLSNQKGDCKDVANLLCRLLNYKGIEAHLALTNIGNTGVIFDFPSLSSANHVVCAVKKDNLWLMLDATDDFNTTGRPLYSLQGRNLFIMSDKKYEYYQYPVSDCQFNKKTFNYELELLDNKLKGNFLMSYNGLSGYILKYLKSSESKRDFDRSMMQFLESVSEEIDYKNITTKESETEFKLFGNSELNADLLSKSGNKTYLLLSFLPFPIPQLVYRNSIDGEFFLENTLYNSVEVQIDLKYPIKDVYFKPVDFEAKNVKFKMNAIKLENTKLKISYEFIINEVFINQSNIYEINKMLSLYNSQKAIIIQ